MHILAEPRALAELTEIDPAVPPGTEDRFCGYGVMGLPFAEGHVLALRRFPASSLGYGYSSVWYRSPAGRWIFWSDVSPQTSCARFFGEAIDEAVRIPITVRWTGPCALSVVVGDGVLDWHVALTPTAATVAMNLAARMLTEGMWRSPLVMRSLGAVARHVLAAGRVVLTGHVPNGQRYVVNPRQVWRVSGSTAALHGVDLGPPGVLAEQARLGDFALPQRGIFALGRSFLEPFDPRRHSDAVVRRGAAGESGIGGMGRNGRDEPAAR